MTDHLPSAARRAQIVGAVLELLADTPVEEVTTRRIARQLGLSQPALFRHFRTRDEILEAVVAHARDALAAAAGELTGSPSERVGALARSLFAHVERHPGLPRVLFYDASAAPSRVRAALRGLVEGQRALVAAIVREGLARDEVPAGVDADRAGALFVALVQGALLQWQLAGRPTPLAPEAAAIVDFWWAAVAAGAPRAVGQAATGALRPPALSPADGATARAGDAGAREASVSLDVRPLLAAGEDPLGAILAALDRTAPGGRLSLTAPFRPAPLLALLSARGCRVEAREQGAALWSIEVHLPEAEPA